MGNYQKMVARIKTAGQDLRTLHRNLVGPEWFATHELLGAYYKKMDEIEDAMVEIGMSQGIPEVSMLEAIKKYGELQISDRKAKESLAVAQEVLESVASVMEAAREEIGDDWICSEIDGFTAWLHLEADYKLDRATR